MHVLQQSHDGSGMHPQGISTCTLLLTRGQVRTQSGVHTTGQCLGECVCLFTALRTAHSEAVGFVYAPLQHNA